MAFVHRRQLRRLGRGVVRQLASLDVELAVDQLVLCGDADPFAGGHAGCPGDRSGDAGEAHDRLGRQPAPANPMTNETFETSPSLTPNTAARARPPATGTVPGVGFGTATKPQATHFLDASD